MTRQGQGRVVLLYWLPLILGFRRFVMIHSCMGSPLLLHFLVAVPGLGVFILKLELEL